MNRFQFMSIVFEIYKLLAKLNRAQQSKKIYLIIWNKVNWTAHWCLQCLALLPKGTNINKTMSGINKDTGTEGNKADFPSYGEGWMDSAASLKERIYAEI